MSNALSMLDKLRNIDLFADLDAKELGLVARHLLVKQYPAGQTLFFAGMPGELMYVVVSGDLEIYKAGPQVELVVAKVGPGEFSGEGSLILSGQRSTNCRVTDDSELLVLTKVAFQDLTGSSPSITTKLLTAFLKANIIRLRQGNRSLEWV